MPYISGSNLKNVGCAAALVQTTRQVPTQAFQAGGFAPCCIAYEIPLCLNMGMAGVHLVFHFSRFPSKQIPNQAFEFSSKKWTFSSVEEGDSRHSSLWCGLWGECADGQWECEAVVLLQGIATVTTPCVDQSSGRDSPWGSGGYVQDLMGIADRLTLQAYVAALV